MEQSQYFRIVFHAGKKWNLWMKRLCVASAKYRYITYQGDTSARVIHL